MFLDFDVKTIVRAGLILLSLVAYLIVRQIAHVIGNEYLKDAAKRIGFILLFVLVGRVVAAYLDFKIDGEVGWFTTLLTYFFNGWIVYLLFRILRKLKEEEMIELHKTGGSAVVINPRYVDKRELSRSINNVLIAYKVNQKKTDAVLKSLEEGLK